MFDAGKYRLGNIQNFYTSVGNVKGLKKLRGPTWDYKLF